MLELRYSEGESTPRVNVLERRGGRARIVAVPWSPVPRENVALVGWVSEADIEDRPNGHGGWWGRGGVRSPLYRSIKRIKLRCPNEVPVIAELDGERHLVAVASPDTPIVVATPVAADATDPVPIDLVSAPLQPAEGARFLALPAALSACTPVP